MRPRSQRCHDVIAYVTANPACTTRAVFESVGGRALTVGTILSRLATSGEMFGLGSDRHRIHFASQNARDEWLAQPEQSPEVVAARRLQARKINSQAQYAKQRQHPEKYARPVAKPKAAPKPGKVQQPRVIRQPARGPAHLSGEPRITSDTRVTICQPMAQSYFSNTFAG